MRRPRQAALLAVLFVSGCSSGSTSPAGPSGTASTLHADVTDPRGDTSSDPLVPNPPDLVHATVDAAGGNLTIVVQFAPGTLDRQTTRVSIVLDTDRDPTTGILQAGGIGADYGLDAAAATGQVIVTKADPAACAARSSCFNAVGSVPLSAATDSVQFSVPLSLVGSGDGRLTFRMSSYVIVATLAPITFDVMPDASLPPGRVQ
jgi:hypothetical protein